MMLRDDDEVDMADIDIHDVHEAEDDAALLVNALRHAARGSSQNVLRAELISALRYAKNVVFTLTKALDPEPRAPVGTAVRPEARRAA